MPIAERLATPLQRLTKQRLSSGEVALILQQCAEVANRAERVRMAHARRLALGRQCLAVQTLSGGVVTLSVLEHAEVTNGGERVRMPIAEYLAPPLQHLT
eukprot:scaffold103639_cov67-Phaeocystis_antarctica.AAC.4